MHGTNKKKFKRRKRSMNNIPVVKLGIVAVSRDCFPMALSERRKAAIVEAYKGEIFDCPTIIETERDMVKAL